MSLITFSDFCDVAFDYAIAEDKARKLRMAYFQDEAIDHVRKVVELNRDVFLSDLCRQAKLMGGSGVNTLMTTISSFTIQRWTKGASADTRHEITEMREQHHLSKTGIYYKHPSCEYYTDVATILKYGDTMARLEAVISDQPQIFLKLLKRSERVDNGIHEIDYDLCLCMRMRGEVPKKDIEKRETFVAKLDKIRAETDAHVTY